MYPISIKIKNYKCFAEEAGFEIIKRVNLIIGRNNSGKSSLLDVIEHVADENYGFERVTWHNGTKPEIIFKDKITKELVDMISPSNTSHVSIGDLNTYGQQYIEREIKWTKQETKERVLLEIDDKGISSSPGNLVKQYQNNIAMRINIALEKKTFKRITAERDINPEGANTSIQILANGLGTTNAIQNFINHVNRPSHIVDKEMLKALNEIFAHDANFTSITCRIDNQHLWEIFLEEEYKGKIALSKSGSGLKTVIIVLSYLFLIPSFENKSLSDYIFGFEELENNIHPSLLRRLNDYLYRASLEHNFIYFLTTHSNVLIDQFSRQDDAQIIHVTQKNSISTCITAKTYIDNNGILDDLDVRASDLLQANGIIWVEGPSDRIYLNRWIELWSDGQYKEGTHYQIIFYGGRLLSHLSAESLDNLEDTISILNANRNAVILIDSDKRSRSTKINTTKQRIQTEFESINALCWITKGKEIENYIPSSVVDDFWNKNNSNQVGQYDSFFTHLESIQRGDGKKYESKKPLLAERLVPLMNRDNMSAILDIDTMMTKLCQKIESWNH